MVIGRENHPQPGNTDTVLALVLEAPDGQTGTHYHRCYLEHAPCLAQLLIEQGFGGPAPRTESTQEETRNG